MHVAVQRRGNEGDPAKNPQRPDSRRQPVTGGIEDDLSPSAKHGIDLSSQVFRLVQHNHFDALLTQCLGLLRATYRRQHPGAKYFR